MEISCARVPRTPMAVGRRRSEGWTRRNVLWFLLLRPGWFGLPAIARHVGIPARSRVLHEALKKLCDDGIVEPMETYKLKKCYRATYKGLPRHGTGRPSSITGDVMLNWVWSTWLYDTYPDTEKDPGRREAFRTRAFHEFLEAALENGSLHINLPPPSRLPGFSRRDSPRVR